MVPDAVKAGGSRKGRDGFSAALFHIRMFDIGCDNSVRDRPSLTRHLCRQVP